MLIVANGHGNAFARKHLYFVLWTVRDGNAVLAQFVDDHLHDFVDVLQSLLAGVSPRGGAVLLERGAIRVPPVRVWFHNNFEGVGLHGTYYGWNVGSLSV